MAAGFNDYERERVPQEKLRSFWAILAVQFGFMFGSSSLVWAMQFTKGLNFIDILIVFAIGHFLVFWMFYFNGIIGIKERLSTCLISQQSFGRIGSSIVGIAIALACIGWMGAQVAATASGINAATGWNMTLLNIIIGLCMIASGSIGFKALKTVSDISVPYFIIICIVGIIIAANKLGGVDTLLAIRPEKPISIMTGISGVIGSIAFMGVVMPDISRYSRSNKDMGWAVGLSCIIGHSIIPIAGVLMAMAAGNSNVGVVTFNLLGMWGVLMLILAGWTTGDNDIYSASLAITSFIPKVSKFGVAIVAGLIGTGLAVAGILNHIMSFLVILSSVAPPIFAVMQADYFILPKLGIERGLVIKEKKLVNISAIIAMAAGAIFSLKIPFGISAVNAVVIALVVYVVLSVVSVKLTGKCWAYGQESDNMQSSQETA